MKYRILTTLLLLLISVSLADAQKIRLNRADKLYQKFKYTEAIDLYEMIAGNEYKGADELHVSTRLAHSYRKINDAKNAEKWYAKSVQNMGTDEKNYYFYALVLRANGKYDNAKRWMKKYLETNPDDPKAVKEFAAFNNYDELYRDSSRYIVNAEAINSGMADFSPAYFGDKLIIVSARDSLTPRKSAWTNQSYYDLYLCERDSAGKLTKPKRMSGGINSKFHEGPVAFSPTDSVLYLTRNNYLKKRGMAKDETTYLKIYSAKQDKSGKWDLSELPFNNDDYSVAHPTLSKDGKRMYFASNMPGSIGGMDIFYVDKKGDSWSEPQNMGKPVNTEGNEIFPFLTPEGTLFFASDMHNGLGGLDIFRYDRAAGKIINPGYPLNSMFDDFGVIMNEKSEGWFSSNRNGGLGNDDIFYFERNFPPKAENDRLDIEIVGDKPIDKPSPINVLANDSDPDNDLSNKVEILSQEVSGAKITVNEDGMVYYTPKAGYKGTDKVRYRIYDEGGLSSEAVINVQILKKTPPVANKDVITVSQNSKDNAIDVTENDYDLDENLVAESVEILKAPKNGGTANVSGKNILYTPAENYTGDDFLVYQISDTHGLNDKDTVFINIKKKFMGRELEKGLEISMTIHFKTARWDILPSESKKLDSVVNFLKEYPTVEIEMGAHTDSRGSKTANQRLSQKRAQSTVDYMVSKGIARSRLKAKGYGESKLTNRCKDGVPCSAEEHQENRRTTIKILKI